jgi:hypothetical protein
VVTGPNGSNTAQKIDYINVTAEPQPVPGIDQYTKLLLHGEGTDGGTAITDSSIHGHIPSTSTGVKTSTVRKKWGAASLYFDGSGSVFYPSSTDWFVGGGQGTMNRIENAWILVVVAGVLGAYLVMFPQGNVRVLQGQRVIQVPALIVIGLWIVLQFFSGIGSIANTADTGGVAYMAHIGGFIAGFVLTFVFRGNTARRLTS